jgi:hypothetical protein
LSITIEFQPDTIGPGGLVLDYSGNNSHCPVAEGVDAILCEDFTVLVTPSGSEPAPSFKYLGEGFIASGNDLFNGNFSLKEAEQACTLNILCTGFTFQSNTTDCSDKGGFCNMYLKSAVSFTSAPGWQAYSNGRRSGGLIAINVTSSVSVDGRGLALTSVEPILDSQTVVACSYGYSTWPVTPLYGTGDGTRIPARPFYQNISTN